LDAVIKIQNNKIIKIHRQSDCSKFSEPVFSNCGPLKKRYNPKIYGEGQQDHPETIHWHCNCL